MLKSLHIQNVRHLEDLALKELGQINLLFGANDSGKSSILEAVALWADPLNPETWKKVAQYRGTWPFYEPSPLSALESITWLFRQEPQHIHPIKLSGEGGPFSAFEAKVDVFEEIFANGDHDGDKPLPITPGAPPASEHPQTLLEIAIEGLLHPPSESPSPQGMLPQHFLLHFWQQSRGKNGKAPTIHEGYEPLPYGVVNALGHRSENLTKKQFSEIIRKDYKSSVLEALRILDPDIEDLAILTPSGEFSRLAESRASQGETILQLKRAQTGYLPISSLGDGLRRILHIALQLPRLAGGILLLDEIEISIHASRLGPFFDWLVANCQAFDIQLFATTHSLEAIDALLGEGVERSASLTAFRLQRGKARRLSGEQLRRLRMERGLEVRG